MRIADKLSVLVTGTRLVEGGLKDSRRISVLEGYHLVITNSSDIYKP